MNSDYTKPPKLFPNEYASFREDILRYIVSKIPKGSVLLDPMAGTAPLLAFAESRGIESHFCDLLPVHFFVNSAKTIDVFISFKNKEIRDKNYLRDKIRELIKPLDAGLKISEEWIDKDAVDAYRESWQRTSRFSPAICKLLQAALVLSVRYFSSFSTTGNTTWIKKGGMPSGESTFSVADFIANRIKNYFDKAYDYPSLANSKIKSQCKLYLGSSSELRLPKRKYIMITSPAFANRYDYIQAYFPELFLLHRIAGCPDPSDLKKRILGTNCVKGFEVTLHELDFIKGHSLPVFEFISNVKEKVSKRQMRRENDYYFRYFVRYYIEIFESLDSLQKYTDTDSEYFIIVQNNIHRGELNQLDYFLLEYFLNKGFEAKVLKSWQRSHQGIRNISKDHPLVVKKHMESIVWAKKIKK